MLDHVTTLFSQKELKHINLIVNDIDENSIRYGYGYGYGYGYYDEDKNKNKSSLRKFFS